MPTDSVAESPSATLSTSTGANGQSIPSTDIQNPYVEPYTDTQTRYLTAATPSYEHPAKSMIIPRQPVSQQRISNETTGFVSSQAITAATQYRLESLQEHQRAISLRTNQPQMVQHRESMNSQTSPVNTRQREILQENSPPHSSRVSSLSNTTTLLPRSHSVPAVVSSQLEPTATPLVNELLKTRHETSLEEGIDAMAGPPLASTTAREISTAVDHSVPQLGKSQLSAISKTGHRLGGASTENSVGEVPKSSTPLIAAAKPKLGSEAMTENVMYSLKAAPNTTIANPDKNVVLSQATKTVELPGRQPTGSLRAGPESPEILHKPKAPNQPPHKSTTTIGKSGKKSSMSRHLSTTGASSGISTVSVVRMTSHQSEDSSGAADHDASYSAEGQKSAHSSPWSGTHPVAGSGSQKSPNILSQSDTQLKGPPVAAKVVSPMRSKPTAFIDLTVDDDDDDDPMPDTPLLGLNLSKPILPASLEARTSAQSFLGVRGFISPEKHDVRQVASTVLPDHAPKSPEVVQRSHELPINNSHQATEQRRSPQLNTPKPGPLNASTSQDMGDSQNDEMRSDELDKSVSLEETQLNTVYDSDPMDLSQFTQLFVRRTSNTRSDKTSLAATTSKFDPASKDGNGISDMFTHTSTTIVDPKIRGDRRDRLILTLDPYYTEFGNEDSGSDAEMLGNPLYRCGSRACSAALHSFDTLVYHGIRIHGQENQAGKYICNWGDCYYLKTSFNDPASWQTHMYTHQLAIRHICRVKGCKQPFSEKGDLMRHMETTHPDLFVRKVIRQRGGGGSKKSSSKSSVEMNAGTSRKKASHVK